MKLKIIASNAFKKDLKSAKKRGLKLDKLELFLFRTGTHADLF